MNIKEVAAIIEAYEDMRMGGEVKHMEQVYGLSGNHKSYLEERHRRHIDFRPFNGYLDGIRRKRYASMILEHAEWLAKMEEAS